MIHLTVPSSMKVFLWKEGAVMDRIRVFKILSNEELADQIFKMVLSADETSWITRPGQFVNITIENAYLKRPISISEWDEHSFTIIYKVVGVGTKQLSLKKPNEEIECLIQLGNGFTPERLPSDHVLLIGGGVGVPPLVGCAKECLKLNKRVTVILGFDTAKRSFYIDKFKALGCEVYVSTNDGTLGVKGFVSDIMKEHKLCDIPYMACGPLPMLKAIYSISRAKGQLSFEERLGCGFGACMGCSCKTISGVKRICKEGPVLDSEEILWKD